jgi:Protein of unknown function (DUF1192)
MGAEQNLERLSREDLVVLVKSLRAEIDRLNGELRKVQRDRHETPPHYL